MSFFKKLFGATVSDAPKINSNYEAFIALLWTVASADGEVEDSEVTNIAVVTFGFPLFRGVDTSYYMNSAIDLYRRHGKEIMPHACAKLSAYEKTQAFIASVDIILSDGQVATKEEEMLGELKEILGVSDDLAEAVVKTMMAKHIK